MTVGLSDTSRRIVYLIDFGLVRRYKEADGKLRPRRAHASFRGTNRLVCFYFILFIYFYYLYLQLRINQYSSTCRTMSTG
jgi:hypothetical protein